MGPYKAATYSRADGPLSKPSLTFRHNVSVQLILMTTIWHVCGTKPGIVDTNHILYF